MRVLVCGSRDEDRDTEGFVYAFLEGFHMARLRGAEPITLLIHGASTGVDSYADWWGKTRLGVDAVKAFPAHWKHKMCAPGCTQIVGKAAGPIRNQQMLDEGKPDLVIAFPGGIGTADMVHRAGIAKIMVIKAEP